MPRTAINYQNIVIYKLVCNDINIKEIYVGSTSDFKRRKYEHKSICNNINNPKYNQLKYKTIRENGGWNNWTMIEIEKYPCNDGNESRSRERFWYDNFNASLNSQRPLTVGDECNDRFKKYRDLHQDKVKSYKKLYNEINKDKVKEYNKEYMKKYKELNKDKIKEYKKKYYQDNKT
jgi:hypothetical protein